MNTLALARHAMGTRFELLLHGPDQQTLRAAGEEALDEIERLDAQLSPYRSTSEIAHLNARAGQEPVRVSPPLFQLLKHIRQLHRDSAGAFDITVGPLLRCWGFRDGAGHLPDPADLAEARARTGMDLIQLHEPDCTVRFARSGVLVDLGAIGKGYAIACAADLLRESGIASALIHGGTSTVCAIGAQPDGTAWPVSLPHPQTSAPLTVIPLRNEALSVSAVWGKSFRAGQKTYGHIINPRSGQPSTAALLAAVVLPSPTESDAFSTALLVSGPAACDTLLAQRPAMRLLLLEPQPTTDPPRLVTRGISLCHPGP